MMYVNGDSWSRNLWIDWSPEDWSWPRQFSQRNNIELLNQSAGCGSNSRILSCLQDLALQGKTVDLVIIAMSTPIRWHLPAPNLSVFNITNGFVKHDRHNDEIDGESLWRWCVKNQVFDELELTYRYFVIMWQIQSLCNNHLSCPVIFFNAWDQQIGLIDKMIADPNQESQLIAWIQSKFTGSSKFEKNQYIDAFISICEKRIDWLFFSDPWTDYLSAEHYDGPADRDPGHPNKQGHQLISYFVENKIMEHFPNILDRSKSCH